MGESSVLLFPQKVKLRPDAEIECHERLGGLLRYYLPERLKWQGRAELHCAHSFRRCWRVARAQQSRFF